MKFENLIYCGKIFIGMARCAKRIFLKISFGERADCSKRTFRTLIALTVKIVEALWRAFEPVDA